MFPVPRPGSRIYCYKAYGVAVISLGTCVLLAYIKYYEAHAVAYISLGALVFQFLDARPVFTVRERMQSRFLPRRPLSVDPSARGPNSTFWSVCNRIY